MILIIGSRGSIGTRYRTILEDMGESYCEYDPAINSLEDDAFDPMVFEKAIIASPTNTHFKYCNLMMDLKKPFLCEKPLSQNLEECELLAKRQRTEKYKGYVVNNWNFLIPEGEKVRSIEYDYYRTGPDGFCWDLAQPIYIGFKHNAKLHLHKKSALWNVRINNESVQYRDIEWSYLDMISAFINDDYESLWTLQDGLQMSIAVQRYMKERNHEIDYRRPS